MKSLSIINNIFILRVSYFQTAYFCSIPIVEFFGISITATDELTSHRASHLRSGQEYDGSPKSNNYLLTYKCGVLHVESTTPGLQTFFLHVLNNIGELSLYAFTIIGF